VPNDQDDTTSQPPADKVTYMSAFDRAHPATSVEAFHVEENSGRNQSKRDLVAEAFRKYGPGSSAEVLRTAGLRENLNLWRARVAELTNLGTLKKIEVRPCRVTNHAVAILQYVEPKDRVQRVRVEPRDQMIMELCDVLERVGNDARVVIGDDRWAQIRELVTRGRSLALRERPRHDPRATQADVDVDAPS
jgi:hypothetical protein